MLSIDPAFSLTECGTLTLGSNRLLAKQFGLINIVTDLHPAEKKERNGS